jgi:hypothetical protein
MFYGFDEFFRRRMEIRHEVDCMDKYQIAVYRLYIYSTPFVTDYIRNNMWDYLMRYEDDLDMVKVYADYKRSKRTINYE